MAANSGARQHAAERAHAKKRTKKASQDNPIVIESSDSENGSSGTDGEAPDRKKCRVTVQMEEEEEAQHKRASVNVKEPEDTEAELERLQQTWTVPIYVFFLPNVIIGHEDGHQYHDFKCAVQSCKDKKREVRCFLDTADARSTSNLHKHAKKCWGEEVHQGDLGLHSGTTVTTEHGLCGCDPPPTLQAVACT